MRYHNVCLEAFAYTLPEEVLTSSAIETRLAPLYTRLRLPEGRLELMTGIAQRRLWAPGTLPSEKSIESGRKALTAAGVERDEIGALIHASVCRDHLEPATAAKVHRGLGLPAQCMVYDVSNACLGFLNGMLQVANMIELGHIRAGLVVASEGSRQLVENTIEQLNAAESLTRADVKPALASLTIGSASAAAVLVDRERSQTGNRLTAAVAAAETAGVDLCQSGGDEAVADGMRPLMHTDSERLMCEGVAAAQRAFARFVHETGWAADAIDKTFCHQVGVAHQKLLFESLGLDPAIDFTTVRYLGNTGSVAVPVTAAIGIEQRHVARDDHVALLGIGSGINVVMLGIDWQQAPPVTAADERRPASRAATAAGK